jgi:hypothetical protein
VDINPTPEERLELIHARIQALQNAEQRKLAEANKNIGAAGKDGGRTGQHCVLNPERLPKSPVEVAVDFLETQLVCSTRAFVYSAYQAKLESLRPIHTAEETMQRVQRALGFALARKASDRVGRNVNWLKTGAAEVELAALGELQLLFLEAETGDTSGEIV